MLCAVATLRRLIVVFVVGLAAVHAVRPGLQPSAALTPQTGGRTCHDIKGTESDEKLISVGVERSQGMCYCSNYPSKECGDIEEARSNWGQTWRGFRLGAAGLKCRCLKGIEKATERSEIVAAAAVRFCAAVLEKTTKAAVEGLISYGKKRGDAEANQQNWIQKKLSVSPPLCQEILTGTLDDFGTSESKELFHDANGLSKHDGTKGWGHLDPLVTGGLPSSTDYQKLLHHVCHDECEEIVNEMLKNIKKMTDDVKWDAKPSEQSCADRVVRQVEAEILGCCGRSCGWDGRSCRSWPFLNKTEKLDWLQQCCSEYNVLQNSSRERMCDSVLSPKQIQLVSKFDTKAKKGDVGGTYIGHDPRLLWAKPGLVKFWNQLKKLKRKPKENEPVSSDFFERNPDVRKKGIEKGWFREEKDPEQSTSLAQLGPATTCDESTLEKMKNHKHCPEQTWQNVKKACFEAKHWQISDMPDEDDLDASQCQLKMIKPDVDRIRKVATPEECLNVKFGQGVKRRFFIYDKSDPPKGKLILDKPILCFDEKDPCPDVERENLDEVDHGRFKGFTKYIYWTEGA